MNWFVETLRDYPAIPIFLTLGLGFMIGKLKYKTFSLGTVTSVLLVGVLVGQLGIPISEPLKSVSFLLFLFAIGYSVGPEFFRALKGSGIKQVIFAVVMCVLCLACTWITALIFGYNPGETLGLFAGSQTISAVIGVGTDSINNMNATAVDKQHWIDMIPVCYAVTYIFGTIGSAWLLGSLGPKMLGGLKKVREETAALAVKMNSSSGDEEDPAMESASRPVVFRAYRTTNEWFNTPRSVAEIQDYAKQQGKRLFVERARIDGKTVDAPSPDTLIHRGDEIVLTGRREFIVQDQDWIGPEVADYELLSFPIEQIKVLVAGKKIKNATVATFREMPEMAGMMISKMTNGSGMELPVLADTPVHRGNILTLQGTRNDVERAAKHIGFIDRPSVATDMVFVGLGVFIGALIGAITFHIGGIPISLSTSGGALIAGLLLGWLRSRRPTFGNIPQSSLWILNNLGLNMFIAVVGITSGPTFISGIQNVGFMLFVAGIVATALPIILGIWIGDKVFHFPAAINLGCVAGSRVTTASLGAIQDSVQSSLPAMGYTITYAIGNTLLIFMAVIMAAFM